MPARAGGGRGTAAHQSVRHCRPAPTRRLLPHFPSIQPSKEPGLLAGVSRPSTHERPGSTGGWPPLLLPPQAAAAQRRLPQRAGRGQRRQPLRYPSGPVAASSWPLAAGSGRTRAQPAPCSLGISIDGGGHGGGEGGREAGAAGRGGRTAAVARQLLLQEAGGQHDHIHSHLDVQGGTPDAAGGREGRQERAGGSHHVGRQRRAAGWEERAV